MTSKPAMLTGVFAIVDQIQDALGNSLELGGILLTKIPKGKEVYWHDDDVSWHARYYDLKVWLPLRANDLCINHVEDEQMVWRPGEAWHHSNMLKHRVVNAGDCERICLIVCMRRI
jgi:aspartyl/asparaginyl beta-hydroxylase (cupin superfamily)